MSIGFAGAQRVGKTTLARAAGQLLNIPFVETTASAIYAQHGMDPKANYSLDDRIWIQQRILAEFTKVWSDYSGHPFVTDRTPLDLYAYLLSEVPRSGTTSEQALLVL